MSCNYQDQPRGRRASSDDFETTVYRLVQEALTNIAKHAGASPCDVSVAESDGDASRSRSRTTVRLRSRESASDGFGLAGMRERVALTGGTLTVDTGEHGTRRRGPVCRRCPASGVPGSASEQAASWRVTDKLGTASRGPSFRCTFARCISTVRGER